MKYFTKIFVLDDLNNLLSEKEKICNELTAIIDKEKIAFAMQLKTYAKVSDELASSKKNCTDIKSLLHAKEKALEQERSDKASIEHSHEELLSKMKELQKENDELVIKLEGLKTENDQLITKNSQLEYRFKIMKDQNNQQLKQINDTLRSPVSPPLDDEFLQLNKVEQNETFLKNVENTQDKVFGFNSSVKTKEIERKLSENTSDSNQIDGTLNKVISSNVPIPSDSHTGAFTDIFSRSGERIRF